MSECPMMNECEFEEILRKKRRKIKQNMRNIIAMSIRKSRYWNQLFRCEIDTSETEKIRSNH